MTKTPEHLAEFTDLKEPISFTSHVGEVIFSAGAERSGAHTTVTTAIDHSSDIGGDDLSWCLTTGLEPGSPLDELVASMMPGGEVDRLATSRRFKKAITALGYIASTEMDASLQGTTRIITSFTYPTTDILNANLRRLLPDAAVTLKDYDGNLYSPDDFLPEFAEDGTVLLARNVPFAVHDHASHVIGWAAQGSELVDAERSIVEAYYARNEADPLALRSLMLSLDSLTGKTTEVLLGESLSRDKAARRIGFELKSLRRYGSGEDSRVMQDDVLMVSGDEPTQAAANEMWERMEAAESRAA